MLGGMLLFVGTVSAFIVLLAIFTLISEGHLDDSGPMYFIAALLTFVGIPLGRRMLRGRRKLVLYLRKFGFTSSTNVLTYAISTAVGKSWRLVTLDDSVTEPLRVPKFWYNVVRWGTTFGWIILIWRFIVWFRSDHSDADMNESVAEAAKKAQESGQGCVEAWLGAIAGALLMAAIKFILILALFVIAIVVVGTLTAYSWGAAIAINKAEKSKAFDIQQSDQIDTQVRKIGKVSKRVFSPRLIIAHVSDTIWRDVIAAIDDSTDYIVIDVSEPTQHLLWEVQQMQGMPDNHIIYVGHEPHMQYVLEPDNHDDVRRQITQLLDGKTVLTYAGQDKRSLRKFAHSFRALLEKRGA